MRCSSCQIGFDGEFALPRLARLGRDHQHLAEQLILTGGNLKELALQLGITYPTLRKQIDNLILELKRLQDQDNQRTTEMLDAVERGELTAESAARMVKEQNGDA